MQLSFLRAWKKHQGNSFGSPRVCASERHQRCFGNSEGIYRLKSCARKLQNSCLALDPRLPLLPIVLSLARVSAIGVAAATPVQVANLNEMATISFLTC